MEVCASSIAASSAFACFDASGPQRALFYHAVLAENAVNHILVGALKSALQNSVHIVFCNGPILGTDHVGKFVVEFCADLVLRPAEQRCQITRQELRGENILYMSPGRRARLLWRRLFHTALVEAGYKPNILFRSADTESILMMVSAEEGVSLLPDYCTNRLYNADNIVFVPLVGEGEEEEIIAAWQSGNKNPALGRFLAELNQKGPPQ